MICADQKTAKIYTFPARPRAASADVRFARLEAEARRFATTEFGSGRYHEDAITEAGKKTGR